MAVSAERFKFLDKETNLAIKEFFNLSNNEVYNEVKDFLKSILSTIRKAKQWLKNLIKGIKDLKAAIISGVTGIFKDIKAMFDEIINMVLDIYKEVMSIPQLIMDVFNTLVNESMSALKDFLADVLSIGELFLCDNLGVMKMFQNGYKVKGNVLHGIMLSALFNWMDRFCKSQSKKETKKATKTQKVENLITPKGPLVNNANAFSRFVNTYRDHLVRIKELPTVEIPTTTFVVENAKLNLIISTTTLIRKCEISNTDKKGYIDALDTEYLKYADNAKIYSYFTKARSMVNRIKISSISNRTSPAPTVDELLNSVLNNTYESLFSTIYSMPISIEEKSAYYKAITPKLKEYRDKMSEGNQLLSMRGGISKIPSVSVERKDVISTFSNLNDQMGGFALKLMDVDLESINTIGLTDLEQSLLLKLKQFKQRVTRDKNLRTRDFKTGSFDDVDFSDIMPALTVDEVNYVLEFPGLGLSHRVHEIHPTTGVFLE